MGVGEAEGAAATGGDGRVPGTDGEHRVEYIGESCKSIYMRSRTHADNYRLMEPKSFWLRHHLEKHGDMALGTLMFRFSAIQYFTSAFRRQIGEAVEIKESVEYQLKLLTRV